MVRSSSLDWTIEWQNVRMRADGIGIEATSARLMSKICSELGLHAYAALAHHLWGTCGFRLSTLRPPPVEPLLGNRSARAGEAAFTVAYR
jgi:hypothetical protein